MGFQRCIEELAFTSLLMETGVSFPLTISNGLYFIISLKFAYALQAVLGEEKNTAIIGHHQQVDLQQSCLFLLS